MARGAGRRGRLDRGRHRRHDDRAGVRQRAACTSSAATSPGSPSSPSFMVWVTFLGGACATRRGAQMTHHRVHRQARRATRGAAADLAVDAVAIGVLVLLVWYGMRLDSASWGNELTVLLADGGPVSRRCRSDARRCWCSCCGTSCGCCAAIPGNSAGLCLTALLILGFFALALAGVPLVYALLGATVGVICASVAFASAGNDLPGLHRRRRALHPDRGAAVRLRGRDSVVTAASASASSSSRAHCSAFCRAASAS